MAIGIILLFFGACIIPSISGNQPNCRNTVKPMACYTYEFASSWIVNFDAGYSSDPDGGSIQEYAWDFDNDGDDEKWGETTTFDFSDWGAGTYYMALWIKDDDGEESLSRKYIRVPGNQGNDIPMNAFTWEYDEDNGYLVNFDGTLTYDPDGGNIGEKAWDFNNDGDDDGYGWTPSWDYTDWGAGSYCAVLWTKDDEGDENLCRTYIEVPFGEDGNDPPNPPSNPSPANHATGVGINADLSWDCSDPNGDSLTYDVYFGTSSSPPLVLEGQTAKSYNPGTMSYNKKYYWKIVAEDEHGATTSGSVWDFTTTGPSNDPPTPPIINAPSQGYEEETIEIQVKSTDPNGDNLKYQIYWGDGTSTGLVGPYTQGQWIEFSHAYDDPGTYGIFAYAQDTHGSNSEESDVYDVTIIGLPDLKIHALTTDPHDFDFHDDVDIICQISNEGSVDATEKFEVVIFGEDEVTGEFFSHSEDISGLKAGYGKTITVYVDWIYVHWVNVQAFVDYHNDVKETNEENNQQSRRFIIRTPDLIVEDVYTHPDTFKPGEDFVQIFAKIKNIGKKAAEHFNGIEIGITIYDYVHGDEFEAVGIDDEIEPGESKTISWTLPYAWPYDTKSRDIKVEADCYTEIREMDETNNIKTIKKSAERSRGRICQFPMLVKFLEQNPRLFPIIRQFLGL